MYAEDMIYMEPELTGIYDDYWINRFRKLKRIKFYRNKK